jgi:hypothetical protein
MRISINAINAAREMHRQYPIASGRYFVATTVRDPRPRLSVKLPAGDSLLNVDIMRHHDTSSTRTQNDTRCAQ